MTTMTTAPPRPRAAAAPALGLPVLLRQLEGELNTLFVEREEAIGTILTTILARENGYVEGEPGTGKSDLLETLMKAVTGGKYARFLMDPFMGKEDVFGAHDIPRYLAGGGWGRDTTDTAVDAHVVLFDEAARAPGGILASMLTLMHEHMAKPNGHWVDAALLSAWGAGNDWLFDILPAMADRFLINMSFEYIKEDANFARVLDRVCDGVKTQLVTEIPLDALLHAIHVEVPAVRIPTGVRESLAQLKSDLRAEQVVLSDRRWLKMPRLVQAAAYKAGKAVADEDDLAVCQHALFAHPDQRSLVRQKVLALTSPLARAAMTLGAQIDSISAEIDKRRKESLPDRASYGAQAQFDLGEIQKSLTKITEKAHRDGRDPAVLGGVLGQIKVLRDKIHTDCLNLQVQP